MEREQVFGETSQWTETERECECTGLLEYLKAEIECMQRESGCGRTQSKTETNMKAIEWIRDNAPGFRQRWEQEHSCGDAA